MNSFPRLLCLMLLSSAAFAQAPSFVSADPSLMEATETQKPQSRPSSITPKPQPDLQLRANPEHPLLPVATVLRLKLNRSVSTASARTGEQLTATLTAPVQVNGRVILATGTTVKCRVEHANGARRFAGKPSITIKAHSAQTVDGDELNFTASVVDTVARGEIDVDDEGNVRGFSPNPLNKIETGALAGVGAVAGAVIAGPEGLLLGTASGVIVAAGHIVVKHRDLTLPAGTELILELDAPALAAAQTAGMH